MEVVVWIQAHAQLMVEDVERMATNADRTYTEGEGIKLPIAHPSNYILLTASNW